MHQIKELQNLIENRIASHAYPAQPAELYEPLSYMMSLGGKRMRPVLLLMACDLFGAEISTALNPAMAIEMFHNFTLVHDDLMDKAPLRRGKQTVHEKWNANTAILSGDVMLVEAYKLMMQVDNAHVKTVLNIFSLTAQGVCEGQQFDMIFEQCNHVSLEDYIDMIRLKTAVLLGGSLKIGAIIGGAKEPDAQKLYDFGEKIGIAFQLQDDILDVYGNPEKFGKQIGGDILANKKTWLLIRALQQDQNTELKKLLKNDSLKPDEKISSVIKIYNKLNIRHQAEKVTGSYAKEALQLIKDLQLPENKKEIFYIFIEMLQIREV